MAGDSTEIVSCCFCSHSLDYRDAVHLTVFVKEMGDERQQLFAHKKCLAGVLRASVPLHPDLMERE